ncbi:hypothetical protein RJ639_017460 [Escallonia herrerae]|uniref:OCRE domain-containing protein n=1 Tax=Escallonia herrerae TaxID=1293975 RepID=A0AA88VHT7_9ASTE|nr:hypothetical protein RJ639_017460 [Escallonia herrerae]
MAEKLTLGDNRKRSLPVDDDGSIKPPAQKRVRFPKGKKLKSGDEVADANQPAEEGPVERAHARLVARERKVMRNLLNEGLRGEVMAEALHDISGGEVHYKDNETFVDDGIQIEPFNLTKEREEGYFDAAGNYVEFVNEKEIKDAWLDNVDVASKFAERTSTVTNNEDDREDISSNAIGSMKRRIADALEPGETVLQALRRLKGTTNNRKEKMSAGVKVVFDQLTEDAMKLMETGDYNVYDEKQEAFQREAEGYERLARSRGEGPSGADTEKDGDAYDMFADDDENATAYPASGGSNLVPGSSPDRTSQPSESSGAWQNDFVYDESSGYYYSGSSGYYYDPSSGLYCCAASGQWYSYNEETGTYDGINGAASASS